MYLLPPAGLRPVVLVLAALACSESGDDPMEPGGVEVGAQSLPASGAAYHGSAAHRFLGGNALLTCSSHGGFSTAVDPPASQGATVTSSYVATFIGELYLAPPLVATATTFPLSVPVSMSELITLSGTQGGVRTFDTELSQLELGGPTAPGGALVRESPTLTSTGQTTITALSSGTYRIESHYDVWLEISLDGGGTWSPAEAAVRMTLRPGTP